MAKKIITVFGATGTQGGSVVDIFLQDPKLKDEWKVRGVTRDVSKPSSKKLEERGVEVVAADMEDKSSLVKAMHGSHTVFAMTNYWEKMSMDGEIQQGKNLADAAVEAGVQHFIWQSLLNITKLSNGALSHVYHFDSKAIVEDYIRTLSLPATFFLPGFYMSNFPTGMFRPSSDSPPAYSLSFPVPVTAPVPLLDASRDTGKFVKGIVLHRDSVLGKQILGATAYLTLQEVLDTFKKAFPGTEAKFVQVSHTDYKATMTGMGLPDFAADELLQNMRLLDEFGYYGGRGLEESHAIVEDELTTWEAFCKEEEKWSGLK